MGIKHSSGKYRVTKTNLPFTYDRNDGGRHDHSAEAYTIRSLITEIYRIYVFFDDGEELRIIPLSVAGRSRIVKLAILNLKCAHVHLNELICIKIGEECIKQSDRELKKRLTEESIYPPIMCLHHRKDLTVAQTMTNFYREQ
ncbi:hypothetical protein BSL78_19416, partial [Apostichopus japonicus]